MDTSNHDRCTKAVRYLGNGCYMALAVLFAAAAIYFWMNQKWYINKNQETGAAVLEKWRILSEILVQAAGISLFLFHKKIREMLKTHAKRRNVILLVFTPFFTYASTFLIKEGTPKNYSPKNYGSTRLTPEVAFYNLLIIAMILLLYLVVTNSIKLASVLCHITCVAFCLADYFVCRFRGNPILASDIASAGTAFEVAGGYTYKLNFQTLFVIQCAMVLILAVRCFQSSKLFALKKRILFSSISVVVLAVFVHTFFISDYLKNRGYKIYGFKPQVSYQRYGGLLTFVCSFGAIRVEKPEDYSVKAVEALAEQYPSDKADEAKIKPNIIVFVSEAFSDPGVIADFDTSEDYLPFFHSLQKDYIHGYTYASVLGGSTANTEFELLTGNSMVVIPPNCVAFQVYFKDKMPSLLYSCKEMGYQELTAIHPYLKNNYNRPTVYSLLGFEDYISIKGFPEDAPKLRRYISDMAVKDMIIERYETAKSTSDQPVCMYTMTMQNHGGYSQKFDNLTNDITILDSSCPEAKQYINLVKHTDDALKELVGYFSEVEEPTVILMLGDHQPALTEEFLMDITEGGYKDWTREDMIKQYAVPFVLWSNYDLPVEKKEYEKTSMNYLQSILMESCGLPLTGFQKYQLELEKNIPAVTLNGYWGADGTFYDPKDTSSPYYEKLKEYEEILYNNIVDYKKRPENFYELAD